MKPFDRTTTSARNRDRTPSPAPAEECAALLLETVPRIMRALRMAITQQPQTLTIPQFRTLHFIRAHSGAGLSATAEFLGLTLPSTSKLVDHMVRAGYLARDDNAVPPPHDPPPDPTGRRPPERCARIGPTSSCGNP